MRRSVVLAGLGALLLAGCVTVPYTPDENAVSRVVALIDSHDVGALMEVSRVPFLFESEILLRPADVEDLWRGLADAGVVIGSFRIKEMFRVDERRPEWSGVDMEVAAFFSRYTDRDTTCVILETVYGEIAFLLGRPVRGVPQILGMRGPAL